MDKFAEKKPKILAIFTDYETNLPAIIKIK